MPPAKIDAVYVVLDDDRFHQCDILRDITIVEWAAEVKDAPLEERFQIFDRKVPYAIVLNQDCDLEQDYANRSNLASETQDKYLQSILLCPAYPEADFRLGKHLEGVNLTMQQFPLRQFEKVRQNQLFRYHFLPKNLDFQVPELVVDFKHHFTIPRDRINDEYRSAHYLVTLEMLFREDLSNRFSYFLSRIALPELA